MPDFEYATANLDEFIDRYGPASPDPFGPFPIRIVEFGVEGVRLHDARLVHCQRVNLDNDNVIGLINMTIAKDPMTGHPPFSVSVRGRLDVRVAYEFPRT
jgi:hypothetical protein